MLGELVQRHTLLLDGHLSRDTRQDPHYTEDEEDDEECVSPGRRRQTPDDRTTSTSDRTSPPARPEN